MATITCVKQPKKKLRTKILICLAFSCNHWAVVSCLTYASTKVDPVVGSWREGELFKQPLPLRFVCSHNIISFVARIRVAVLSNWVYIIR